MTRHRAGALATATLGLTATVLVAACGSGLSGTPTASAASAASSAASAAEAAPASAYAESAAAAGPATSGADACSLVTEQDVTAVLGSDLGAGSPFTNHGASQCQYGTFGSALVLVNLTPTQGRAAYDLMHGNQKLHPQQKVTEASGLGDRAFELTGPGMASYYVGKGDALLLVMVTTRPATPATPGHALALARTATARL